MTIARSSRTCDFVACISVSGSMSRIGGSRTAVDLPHPAQRQLFGSPGPEVSKAANPFAAAHALETCGRFERAALNVTEQHKRSETELVGKGRPRSFPLSSQPRLSRQS
jgi:hypothetical protein